MTNKFETRNQNGKDFEKLSLIQEIRASDDSEDGIIEGYVAVWDTVDSYNSRFQRGCFKKTIENRMHKIKVLWNHDTEQPIGKLTEIREDDHGLFIRAQLITDVDKAKETFSLIKGGAIDCFSFGFRTIKDKFEQGIQVITEVMLGEVSPVVFEANSASKITGVRADNFIETAEANELRQRGGMLMNALWETMDDIWWGESESSDKVSLVTRATADFALNYTQWAQEIVDLQTGGIRMALTTTNELAKEFRTYCTENKLSLENIAQDTSFTMDELRLLKSGKTITDQHRLTGLSEGLLTSHNNVRSRAVETLCDELRAGINTAEATRIKALLQKSLHNEVDDVVAFMSDFRNKLIGDK